MSALIDAATEIEQEDARAAGAVGYAARLWAQLTLPYRQPPADLPQWVRKNGSLTLKVLPGTTGPRVKQVSAYPYGVLPRFILHWMSTEVVRNRARELSLGDSLSDFIRRLGMPVSGGPRGTINRLNDQMQRLLTSSMYVEDARPEGERWSVSGVHFSVASRHRLWFDNSDTAGTSPLWGSTLTLSQEFYDSIVAAPIPIDTRALAALGGSPMRIDILVWLAHRLGYLRRSSVVPWELLRDQFGSDFVRLRDFKADFLKHLRQVLTVYSTAKVDVVDSGLLLHPSPTLVPRRPASIVD